MNYILLKHYYETKPTGKLKSYVNFIFVNLKFLKNYSTTFWVLFKMICKNPRKKTQIFMSIFQNAIKEYQKDD